MPRINILPPQIANKIAAGEVVERPASVVKELVENAIDARADKITVIISRSGKELIQVLDNGVGMAADDAELALMRHATSKIAVAEDLERILSLGFRGEALPSIASVSRIEMKTCPEGSNLGTRLEVVGGRIETREKIAFKQGTSIAVKNLFFNTPARRNFLRTDVTEFNQILKNLRCFFLAYPEIHFILIHNGEELYNLLAEPMDERIARAMGKKYHDGLIYFREELNDIVLEGYVCKPDHTRGNSANQYIFLNRRVIVNRSLSHAIVQGYGNLIDRSRYPQYVMNLHLPPNMVDVNVHPTKMEVRFTNDRVIYQLFLSAVRKAIQSQHVVHGFSPGKQEIDQQAIRQHFRDAGSGFQEVKFPKPTDSPKETDSSKPFTLEPKPPVSGGGKISRKSQESFSFSALPSKPAVPSEEKHQWDAPAESDESTQPNLWQVHNRYIFSQIKSGLVIIDQNVAHQRILYEQLLNTLQENRTIPSQQLLFPQQLELALEEFLIYEDIRDWLKKIGFSINELSGRTLVVEAIPSNVKVSNETRILLDIIDFYQENDGMKLSPEEKIAAAFSSKNAIKTGEKLNRDEMHALVDQLFSTREPYFSPGGRPVVITLDMEELERKFKRPAKL